MDAEQNIWKRKYLKVFTLFSLIGFVLGSIGGYFYYLEVGCSSGGCAISSNPYASVAWGAAVGYLLGDMFNGKDKENKENK